MHAPSPPAPGRPHRASIAPTFDYGYQSARATNSPYPDPQQRNLSRSSTYLASLGSPQPPPPPPAQPPFPTHNSDTVLQGRPPLPSGWSDPAANERARAPGPGGWPGTVSRRTGASNGAGGGSASFPPARPALPSRGNSTSSGSTGGSSGGSNGGRKLVKKSRSAGPSPSPSPTRPDYPSPPLPPGASSSSRSRTLSPPTLSPPAFGVPGAPPFPPSRTPSTSHSSLHRSPSSPYSPPGHVAYSPYPPAGYVAPFPGSSPYPPATASAPTSPAQPAFSQSRSPPPPVANGGSRRSSYATGAFAAAVASTPQQSPREKEEEDLARILRTSAEAEAARLAQQRAAEEAYRRTLSASSASRTLYESQERERVLAEERALHAALADSRAAEERERREAVRRRVEEEREVQRAIAASRAAAAQGKGKGKGRAVDPSDGEEGGEEDEWARREREALELAMKLSIEDAERRATTAGGSWGGREAEMSAQAWERLSRPAGGGGRGHQAQASTSSAGTVGAVFNDHGGEIDYRRPSIADPHPLFDHPAASPPSSRQASLFAASSSSAAPHDPHHQHDPEHLPAPPAYELPAHAAEMDEPDDLIVGPGRLPPRPPLPPFPPPPVHSASTSPPSHPVFSALPPSPPDQPRFHPAPLTVSASESRRSSLASLAPSFQPSLAPSGVSGLSGLSGVGSILASAGSFSESVYSDGEDGGTVDEREGEGGEEGDPFGDEYSVFEREEDAEEEEEEENGAAADEQQPERPAPPDDLFSRWARRESQSEQHRRPPMLALSPSGSVTSSTARTASSDETAETPLATAVVSLPSPATSLAPTWTETETASSPYLSPPPTAPLPSSTSGASSLSPAPSPTASFRSLPTHGGYVSEPSSLAAPFARQDVLDGVKWGFVDPARAAMHPPLEYVGDFPRAGQLSAAKDEEGREEYRCFAVEAGSWQALLVYLMWHGNSRFEAAPSDLQADKLNRGLQASLSLDFFRSFTDHSPRVRVLLTLLPQSHTAPLSPSTASAHTAVPVDTPTFAPDCPSVRLSFPCPLTLPVPLSTLATTLSHAHTASRQALKLARTGVIGLSGGVGGAGLSSHSASLLADRSALALAVDLFRQLNGERSIVEEGREEEVTDAEVGVLDRLKARLHRSRKVRVLEGESGRGRGRAGGGPLPEGALLITPFSID
ncbi:hypothetical protein JCM8097_002132 [Rhodosporidiobolus ruineniae]